MQLVSIVGCGYTGCRLAARWQAAGTSVRGLAASIAGVARIAAAGTSATQLDLDAPIDRIDMDGHLVYYAVPPAKIPGDPRLRRFLDAVSGTPRRIIYFSTTGVYGDHAGAVVDEDTPPAPLTPRAQRRLAAENMLRSWADNARVSWCVLRVPGIYGPGRLPLDRLRREEPAIDPREASPGNRIQVTDLVTVCMAAAGATATGTAADCAVAHRRIYNVTDGSKHSQTEYLQRVAAIAGLPAPPLISRAQAERFAGESWSFLAESRRVDNRRMLRELRPSLQFADLDAGIRASLLEA